jgi:hypothetical protein
MKKTTLSSLYSFPGFRALSRLKNNPDDPGARIIVLRRRQKKLPVPVVGASEASTIALLIESGTSTPAAFAFILSSSIAACSAGGVAP